VGLGNLKTYGGLRQGSQSYNIDRLKKYLYYGDGTYDDLVNTLLNEAMNDQLESFASFYRGKKLYELPRGWPEIPAKRQR
jgi:hypothetical protein